MQRWKQRRRNRDTKILKERAKEERGEGEFERDLDVDIEICFRARARPASQSGLEHGTAVAHPLVGLRTQ